MKRFSPKRRVLSASLGGEIDKTPVTSVAGCGGTVCVDIQKATGILLGEAHKDPDKMAKLAIASHQLTGLENARCMHAVKYYELAADKDFQDEYIKSLYFSHANLNKFPSTAELLRKLGRVP